MVSMHIAGFEAELGYKLFDRTPKPVLTAQGRELLVGAKRVLVEADRLQNRALTLNDTQTPSIYTGIDLVLEAPVLICCGFLLNHSHRFVCRSKIFRVRRLSGFLRKRP